VSTVSTLDRFRAKVAGVVLRETEAGQGLHIDPEDPATAPPSTAGWTDAERRAHESPTMGRFADGLRPLTGGTVRDGVIEDLAGYHHLDSAQVVHRCLHWEEDSVAEWKAAPRDTEEGLADFYNTTVSWSFDLLWYAYLQTAGYGYPKHVVIADELPLPEGATVLDFGSGVGVAAQLFAALGYEVSLADVSAPLLEFARWRLEHRAVAATYIQLPAELPDAGYHLITAIDTLAHVPDPVQTARQLYRATRPGGYLVTNFDVRKRSDRNAWHLYEDDLPLRWAVESAGFVPRRCVDGMWVYRAEPASGSRRALSWLRLASPPAQGIRLARRAAIRAAVGAIQVVQRGPAGG